MGEVGEPFLREGVVVGERVMFGAMSVIGAEAFWFPRDPKNDFLPSNHKTEGGLIIENDVMILSNCCIERGLRKGSNTIIHAHTKLDNCVLIGHDCDIGIGNRIAAGAVLAGHIKTGKNVFIGVNATIAPKVTIGDESLIGAGAVVICDVPPGEVWAGNPAKKIRDDDYFKQMSETPPEECECERCGAKVIRRMNELGDEVYQCIHCHAEYYEKT